jgi:hypothetical protein
MRWLWSLGWLGLSKPEEVEAPKGENVRIYLHISKSSNLQISKSAYSQIYLIACPEPAEGLPDSIGRVLMLALCLVVM